MNETVVSRLLSLTRRQQMWCFDFAMDRVAEQGYEFERAVVVALENVPTVDEL